MKSKILIGLFVIEILISSYFIMLLIPFFTKEQLPSCTYNSDDYTNCINLLEQEYYSPYVPTNKQELKKKIQKDSNLKSYLYFEKDLEGATGLAFVAIRTIIVDKHIELCEYAITLYHETLHLKTIRKQENYIQYETFKALYESKDTELHHYGACFGMKQLYNMYNDEYSCIEQIIYYLLKE